MLPLSAQIRADIGADRIQSLLIEHDAKAAGYDVAADEQKSERNGEIPARSGFFSLPATILSSSCIGIVVDRSRSADDRAYGEERRGRRQHRQPRRIDRDSLAFSLNGNGALNHHRLEFR